MKQDAQRRLVLSLCHRLMGTLLQASPGVAVRDMLEEASGEIATSCLPEPARERSLAQWQKADAYYFCNIARVKRVWQVRLQSLSFCKAISAHN